MPDASRRRARPLLLACLVAAVVFALGVSIGGAVAAGAKRPPWLVLVEDCLTPAEEMQVVGLRAWDGTRLAAIVLGGGKTGVVLVHGSRGDLCEWMWYARTLSRRHRVIVVDLRASGSSYPAPRDIDGARYERDVLAATAELRRRGSERIFAMGSSLGAGVVLVAAPLQRLAGVVALSAPATTGAHFSTLAAARRITAPVLYVASRGDRAFAPDARSLYDATRTPHKRLLIVDGAGHGSGLLAERRPAAAVRAFLASPPGG